MTSAGQDHVQHGHGCVTDGALRGAEQGAQPQQPQEGPSPHQGPRLDLFTLSYHVCGAGDGKEMEAPEAVALSSFTHGSPSMPTVFCEGAPIES